MTDATDSVGAGGTTGNTDTAAPAAATSATSESTVPAGAATEEEVFFDPKDLAPELQAGWKQLQKAFTQKTQAIAANRKKIDQYDAFVRDPVGSMQQMAARLGYTLTPAQAAAAVAAQQAKPETPWQPQSWDEVIAKSREEAVKEAETRILERMKPVFTELESLKRTSIEQQLDDAWPEWRQHEDAMIDTLQKHPTLANDPATLARVSVPQSVLESKAMQAAMRKLETRAKTAAVGSGSSANKAATNPKSQAVMSFDEAVAYAKNQLRERGLRPPA